MSDDERSGEIRSVAVTATEAANSKILILNA